MKQDLGYKPKTTKKHYANKMGPHPGGAYVGWVKFGFSGGPGTGSAGSADAAAAAVDLEYRDAVMTTEQTELNQQSWPPQNLSTEQTELNQQSWPPLNLSTEQTELNQWSWLPTRPSRCPTPPPRPSRSQYLGS